MGIPRDELRRLRNEIDIASLIERLAIPSKVRDGYLRFLCPVCSDFHTATNPRTNLARCFRCERNFNPIDLLIVERGWRFLDAVRFLQRLSPPGDRPRAHRSSRSEAHRPP